MIDALAPKIGWLNAYSGLAIGQQDAAQLPRTPL